MNLGSQRIMKMGCVVREPRHGLAAQLREVAIFEGEPTTAPGSKNQELHRHAGVPASGAGGEFAKLSGVPLKECYWGSLHHK